MILPPQGRTGPPVCPFPFRSAPDGGMRRRWRSVTTAGAATGRSVWGGILTCPPSACEPLKAFPSNGTDEFTGPEGEVLVPFLSANGEPETRATATLLGVNLGSNFTVHAYRSRTEDSFSRTEHWVPVDNIGTDFGTDFWVRYEPDGQVHLFGRTPQARVSNPDNAAQVAVWLRESSVSLTGEQIYYQYRAESNAGCQDAENRAHPAVTAQRYLSAAWYGNRKAARELPALAAVPSAGDWLFTLMLDYGERDATLTSPPSWLAPGSGDWLCRQDCFSGWEYGFEVRTRRLCRQVLMYHAVTALAGNEKPGDEPQLVSRFLLSYSGSPSVSTLISVQQAGYEADGTPGTLPPLTFGWQSFTPPETGAVAWQHREDMAKLNLLQPYQLVDLNGEGLAGILYQHGGPGGTGHRCARQEAIPTS
ncbi:putative toxin subunit [Candidatus Paraburkholderia kirkii]|nr:putative toxin subunit [Candidatus Paraburkholderia kirkii]